MIQSGPAPCSARHAAPSGRLRPWWALLAALALAACTTVPEPPPGPAPLSPAEERAAALASQGRYQEAAQAYLSLARAAQGEAAKAHRLQAAHAYVAAGDPQAAAALLEATTVRGEGAALRALSDAARARLALSRNQPYEALKILQAGYGEALPDAVLAHRHEVRAQAYEQAGNHLEAARERVELSLYLREPAAARNRARIWELLNTLGPAVLEQARPPAPDTLGGWMELAWMARESAGDYAALSKAVQRWRARYPGHPAAQDVLGRVLEAGRYSIAHPEHIALLLPLHGPFAEAAQAVRDGLVAAWFASGTADGSRPRISVYEAGPASVWSAYQAAVDAGAQLIVGPLDKESVSLLARSERLAVPVLALNRAEPAPGEPAQPSPAPTGPAGQDAGAPPVQGQEPAAPDEAGAGAPDSTVQGPTEGLYQFGLIPEGEAEEVARRAWRDGHAHAALLYPESDWGARVREAFVGEWQRPGGIVVTERAYGARAEDLSARVEQMLHIDRSQARARLLEGQLGTDLRFEPRRRQDIDLIFMAAFSGPARQLRPQIKFHRASDLPVYATSHVYGGTPDPEANRDLDGVIFGDMPWVLTPGALRGRVAGLWQERLAAYPRLFALGVDAYGIIAHLGRLRAGPYAGYQGTTGRLSLDEGYRVERELVWGRFQGGLAVPLDEAQRAQ